MNPSNNSQTDLSPPEQRLIHAMQLLGDTTRYKMFKLMMSDKELCVSEIAGQLDITPSAVSQHFRSFELAGLVSKKRLGQKVCYVLSEDDLINDLQQISQKIERST